jgi:phytoene dehydrogenase-like protein
MDRTYDVIIIGSGIGGLTAGNYLARDGFSTLIIEQGPRPGGCATSFQRGGFSFDAAVHWIAQCGEGGVVHQILKELNLAEKIEFVRVYPPLAVVTSRSRYVIPAGKSEALAYLQDRFPSEREGIDRFFAVQGRIAREMVRLFEADPDAQVGMARLYFHVAFPLRFPTIARHHRKPGAEVVDRLVRDPDLRRILKIAAIFPRVSMVMLAWFWNIITSADCYYPKGGIQRISDTLAENFGALQGEILYNCKAVRILSQNGVARGVRLSDGREIYGKAIISNADARQTFLELLKEDGQPGDSNLKRNRGVPRRYLDHLRKWRLSESFFYVYLGVDMNLRRGEGPAFPVVWYFPEKRDNDSLPDYIGIVIPSLSDEGVAPSGKHTVVIGAFADRISERWFVSQGRFEEGEYRKWKEEVASSLIRIAGEVFPDLESHILVREAASPLTFHRYTLNSMGASSGWSMDAEEQNKLSQRTPIRNLLLAGHWTFNPGGLPAAFISGRRAAEWTRKIA